MIWNTRLTSDHLGREGESSGMPDALAIHPILSMPDIIGKVVFRVSPFGGTGSF
jgi:hypothetical protein